MDPNIGRTVGGRYRLISRLGTGGMSNVYLARHVFIERLVAVKTLRRDLSRDPIQRDRFLREARAVNRINHDNIVEITDFGESEDGLVYLVMEYVPGESLLSAISRGRFTAAQTLDLARQIGGALGRAHQMGVVHRDLKPENILLVARRTGMPMVKVLDFGIAKIMDAPSLTGSQQIFGTPGYIAPEYIQSTEIDGRADLYSLGVLLYEVSTQALPFDYEYPGDLLVKHVTESPIPPRARADVEPALEALILRCLRKDPDERFRDAYHFLDEVQKCAEVLGDDGSWGAMSESRPSILPVPMTPLEETLPAEDGDFTSPPGLPGQDAPAPDAFEDSDERAAFGKTALNPSPSYGVSVNGEGSGELERTLLGPGSLGHPDSGEVPTEDTILDSNSLRLPTASFDRGAIPAAPDRTAVPADVHVPAGVEVPRTADSSRELGFLGVLRWRERFEVLCEHIANIEAAHFPAPLPIARAIAESTDTLEEIEATAVTAEQHQREMEQATEAARRFRAQLGRRQDELALALSIASGERDSLRLQLAHAGAEHDQLAEAVHAGRGDPGAASALREDIRRVEAELEVRAAECLKLSGELTSVQEELDQKNEEHEAHVANLQSVTSREIASIDASTRMLRPRLDRLEAFVRQTWEVRGAPEGLVTPSDRSPS